MRIFISWSGSRSMAVASALRDWLPLVYQSAEPFMSMSDIQAGSRWQDDVSASLEAASFGIVCVTSANQASPWLVFEAGALSKVVSMSRVIPLAIDLKVSDVRAPLGQFQSQPLTYDGVVQTILSIDSASDQSKGSVFVERSVRKWWPDLEDQAKKAAAIDESPREVPLRSERELLEEILNGVRDIQRQDSGTVFGRLSPQLVNSSVQVHWKDGEPIEFMRGASRKELRYSVEAIRERWIEESPWPWPSPMPVGGDRLRCWRVLAKPSDDPDISFASEFVLRMRCGPGVWDMVRVAD